MKWRVNGEEHKLEVHPLDAAWVGDRWLVRTPSGTFSALAVRDRGRTWVSFRGETYELEPAAMRRSAAPAVSGTFTAPMPGAIADVVVTEGQEVSQGARLLVLEAMKTQMPIVAPFDGVVQRLPVAKGEQVAEGQVMVVVAPLTAPD